MTVDFAAVQDRVHAALTRGDWGSVLAECAPALAVQPADVSLLLACHTAHAALGDLVSAREAVERALAADPRSAAALYHRAQLELREGRPARALEDAAAAIALAPRVARHHACHAEACRRLADHGRAAEGLQRAVAIDPKRPRWWRLLGLSLAKLGRHRESAEALAQAVSRGDGQASKAPLEEARRKAEAMERGEAVGGEASAHYYDSVYAASADYRAAAETSPYAGAWRRVVERFEDRRGLRVLDLGCGPGQSAEFVSTHRPDVVYRGLDFSAEAIAQAGRRCPQYRFEQARLPDRARVAAIPLDLIVCTEVLEHIDDDVGLLASLPRGVPLVASVPNYDSFGHVRVFPSPDEVRTRYGPLVDDLAVEPVPVGAGSNIIWLFHGVCVGS